MQELIGKNEDILFDLEQIKLATQEPVQLSCEEKERLETFFPEHKEQEKEKILKKKETERKEFMRIWVLELEEKVHQSDLPIEIKNQILELTTFVRSRDMKFIYDVERKIKEVQRQIKEHEQKESERKNQEKRNDMAEVAAVVVGGAVLGPFIHVRYNEEEFNKKIEKTYTDKTLVELAQGQVKEIKQYHYPKKQGSRYSKKNDDVVQKQQAEIADIMVRDTQRKQKEAGLPVQDAETIKANIEKMHPVKKRYAEKAIYIQNPELKQRHEEQKKEVSSEEILKGVVRAKRRQEEKNIALLHKRIADLKKEPKTEETEKQVNARILALEKRVMASRKLSKTLGLFVDNFEKVLESNKQTASSVIELAKDNGNVMPDAILDTISSFDMRGMKMCYQNPQAENRKSSVKAFFKSKSQVRDGLKKVLAENSSKKKATKIRTGILKIDWKRKSEKGYAKAS